ncbi:MAG: hypothetical protein ACT4OX_15480 [Actinomycetota bacterium]
MPSLAGRVVVIARADADDGAALASALAAAGAHVVLVGTDGAVLGALASSVRAEHGVRVAVYLGDARDAAFAEMVTELFDARPRE